MNMTSNRVIFKLLLSVVVIALFTGCAVNESVELCLTGHKYGFFGGLWHGFIAPFDFIGMLFNPDITMYAQNNNGGLYALGFLLGSGGWGFFGSKGARRFKVYRFSNHRSNKFDHAEIIE
jgi:hypothetical protein